VLALTDTSGQPFAKYSYDSFGNPNSPFYLATTEISSGFAELIGELQSLRYAGYVYDLHSKLYYCSQRYYDPKTASFISLDPIKADGQRNGYMYCSGEPVGGVDATGMRPTALEAAYMSKHIYTRNGPLIGGWRYMYSMPGGGGMIMGIYHKALNSEYTRAFKGTTPTSLNNWKNNAQQLFGKSDDMRAAIREARSFATTHRTRQITFTGHSKGGAEAAASSIATSKGHVTFNPAGLNWRDHGLTMTSSSAGSTNYIVKGDILNYIQGSFGKIGSTIYLKQQYGGKWYQGFRTTFVDRIRNHSIEAVMRALR
jgi:RHS repeat-associated protein